MISIDKLVQQLQQCKDTSITLPSINDFKYIQNTAFDIRKAELELLNNNFEKLNEANYTMDLELEKINSNSISNTDSTLSNRNNNGNNGANNGANNGGNKDSTQDNIPNKSLIIYMENEVANIPEILLNLLPTDLFKPDEWYIYGVKNPESFYKSFLLLSKVDFIIKNKTEKKNEVATFKREMAIQYETLYKSLNYRKLRFPRNDMVNNLINIDNYTEYDLLQYIADYSKINYIILDIITEKYIDIKYNNNGGTESTNSNTILNNEFAIIIKYASNTYLPLMNSNGKHGFNKSIINIISKHFERIVITKYKEFGNEVNEVNEVIEDNEDNENNEPNEPNEANENNKDNKLSNEIDNFVTSYNIEDIYKLSIDNTMVYGIKNNELNQESLINKSNNSIDIVNNIIDIEEQEEEPMGLKSSISSTENTVPTIPTIPSVKANKYFGNSYRYNNNEDSKPYDNEKKCNDIESLLLKVPMSSDIKPKKTKKQIAIEEKIEKEEQKKIANTTNTSTNTTTSNNDKEELKPLAKYNLVDLQILAKLYKLDTQKMGNCDKKINKLKGELYEEIKAKM